MKYTQNLHTHTNYCDGKNTPEEIILKAIELEFDTIGFSGHSPVPVDDDYFMSEEKVQEYKAEISQLKEKYADKIKVLCGIELDMFSNLKANNFDYIIGSNHHIIINNTITDIDRTAEYVQNIIDTYFDSDGLKYAKAYYETLAKLPDKINADIIGHFDLITKHSDTVMLFDTQSKEYKNAALEALHTINKKIDIYEINTGAISRGYKKSPYPDKFILKKIKDIGGHIVITSDCHDKDFLDANFDLAIEILKECKFKEVYILTENGFKGIPIK